MSVGFVFYRFIEISAAIAYVSTFRLFVRLYTKGDKTSIIKLLLPVAFYMVAVLVSTDRNKLLRYFIFFACLMIMFHYKSRRWKRDNIGLLRKIIPFMAAAV